MMSRNDGKMLIMVGEFRDNEDDGYDDIFYVGKELCLIPNDLSMQRIIG